MAGVGGGDAGAPGDAERLGEEQRGAAEAADGGVPGRQRGQRAGASMDTQIEALRQQQKDLRSQRDRIRKDLKNAQKRRSRLKRKAARLSNTDLFDLIALRGATAGEAADAEAAAPQGGDGAAAGAAGGASPRVSMEQYVRVWGGAVTNVERSSLQCFDSAALFAARMRFAIVGVIEIA